MVKITYKKGDKVFAKVKGYPPWPAQVVGDTGKKKYNVLFYGTQETGAIKPEDLSYYLKYKGSYVHKYLKRAGYEDAVKQIEEAIKKDGGDGNDVPNEDDSAQDVEGSDASSISSVTEKKTPKRKVTSLPTDEPPAKRTPAKGRRRSVAIVDSKEDNSEEPIPKITRRKSSVSTEENSEETTAKVSQRKSSESTETKDETEEEPTKSSDSGLKDATQEQVKEDNEIVEVEPTEKPSKTDQPELKNPEDTTSASETEALEKAAKETEAQAEKPADESPTKKSDIEAPRKPKEPEFVEIKTNIDEIMEMEEEAIETAEKSVEKAPVKVEIVTEQSLNNNILYAEHVKKDATLYNDKPVEPRHTSEDDTLAVKLPSGVLCGVKLHKEWPLTHDNERDRTLYDEKVAKWALEVGESLSSGKKTPREVDADVIPNIDMTLEDLKEITYARDIESKRKRLDVLKKEADLVAWDSKIKNNLGLDKASPEVALKSLKEFNKLEKDLTGLMFKKHPHVLDTVRRLRKYVGNVKEWDMSDEDVEIFTKKAEKIRNEAEKIYNKIKNVIQIKEEKGTFWDSFMELVVEFRMKCKEMSENEIVVLCAEPDSRQAFLDKLDEAIESDGTNINPSNTSEPVLKETSVQGWSEKK